MYPDDFIYGDIAGIIDSKTKSSTQELSKIIARNYLKDMSIISENCKAVDIHKYFDTPPIGKLISFAQSPY